MKKFLSISLVFILTLGILVGCTEKSTVEYEDGTFNVELEADERGWKPILEITVENGKITEVNYDEVNEEGVLKSTDEEYAESMKGVSGVSPAEAYELLEKDLIDKQDVDKVDMVSGATTSSENFKELVNEALKTK